MSEPVPLPDRIIEAEAYKRFPDVLGDKELRHARQRGIIGYYRRRGKIYYREDELLAFVQMLLEGSYVPPCEKSRCSGSGHIGEDTSQDQPTSTASGMTPEQEKSASDLLRQEICKKRSGAQPRSGSRKAKLRLVSQET